MVTSGPSDADAARAIVDMARARLGPAAGAAISHGQFDVAELRALAARAAVYIGGDSGPLHIAATTQTPIVALFGPDARRAIDAVARPALVCGGDRRGSAAVPAVSSAALRAGRFSLPDPHFARARRRRRRTRADAARTCMVRGTGDTRGSKQRMTTAAISMPAPRAAATPRADGARPAVRRRGGAAMVSRARLHSPDRDVHDVGGDARPGTDAAGRARVLPSARRLRPPDARRVDLLRRSAREPDRQQAARAAGDGPGGLRHRARIPRGIGGGRHHLHRRGHGRLRHHPVRAAALRQPRAASAGHALALHDLLGRRDADPVRRRVARHLRHARARLARPDHAGAGRRAGR